MRFPADEEMRLLLELSIRPAALDRRTNA
jgi:hypothetical protein